MGVTRDLAEFVSAATWSDFPTETIQTAKGLLLKTIAGMVVGCREPVGRTLTGYVAALGGAPEVGVVGGGFRTTAENAAWAHGTFAHSSELEDDTFPTVMGDYWVFPALFSLGEKLVSSGRDIIEAAILGFEVGSRLCDAGSDLDRVGIVPSTWLGPIATAAATAKLLRLSADKVQTALSIASSHGSGLTGQLGWDPHFLETGAAQRAGVMSACLAKEGCTGRPDILELSNGIYGPVWERGKLDLSSVTAALGRRPFAVHKVWVKKFPCCFFMHTAIDALMIIVRDQGLDVGDIHLVEVESDPDSLAFVDRMTDALTLGESRFSLQYALAEVLLKGRVDLDSFARVERLNEPLALETMSKIKLIAREDWSRLGLQAQVTVVTKDGRRLTQYLKTAIGGTDHPMTLGEIADVSRPYLDAFLPEPTSRRVEAILLNLEEEPDVRELMNLLTFFRNTGC